MLTSRFKNKLLVPKFSLVVVGLIIFGLYLPPVSGDQISGNDIWYWTAEGSEGRSIEEVLTLPQETWSRFDHRPWSRVISGPQEAWTKVRIPPFVDGKKTALVADISFPMHREIRYYLVQGGVIVDSSDSAGGGTQYSAMPKKHETHLKNEEFPGVFVFPASAQTSLDLYVHSTILGSRLPQPSIMTSQDYAAQRSIFDILVGVLIGASMAMFLYNLVVGLMLRRPVYLYFSVFVLGTLGVAFLATGTAERLLPTLAYDHELYTLIASECGALAIIGICLFELRFFQLSLVKQEIKTTHRLVVAIAAMAMMALPWINSTQRPTLLTLIMLAALALNQYVTMTQSDLKIVREYSLGIAIFHASLLISIASWYELIQPHFMRTMCFQFGVIGTSIYFSSAVTLRYKEIQAKKSQLVLKIKNEAQGVAVKGNMTGQLSSVIEEAEVVIMFIDIASFSQLSAPLPSRVVFEQLSKRLGEIATIIRDLGGNIDRSLGDGLLCFFGYRLGETTERNTRRAFLAARKIQEYTVVSTLTALGEGQKPLVMPVRIGIHSSKMLLGNVGGATRIDFTMIGTGVNFASRLEAACSPFKLMLSETCYQHLLTLGYMASDFSQVSISIKHKAELMTSYEYDPFRNRAEDLCLAERAYFQNLGIHTRDRRYQVRNGVLIALRAGDDELLIRDVSRFGFRILSRKQFGRHTRLSVKVNAPNFAIVESLKFLFVDELTIEVRWSRQSSVPDTYEHGVKIVGSSKDQRDFLFETLVANYAELSPTDIEQLFQEAA